MLNKDLLTMKLVDGVLNRLLKGKVRSGAKHDRLSPYDIRRINTYTDILKGIDWSMREELFSQTCVWLLENPLLTTIENDSIEFIDDSYYHYCKYIDRYMEMEANRDGWVERKVTKTREDGTKYRTSVYECRKLMFDVSDSEDENPVLLKIDSKALREYLLTDCYDVDGDFIDLIYDYKARYINGKSEKRRLYWNCFYANVIECIDIDSIANTVGKSTKTVYRWISQVKSACVDFIREDRKNMESEHSVNIITNVSVQSENATFGKCDLKGNAIVKGKEIDVVLDGNVYDNPIVVNPRFTNDGCNNHSYSDNWIGWCFEDFINNLEFIDKPIRKKARKGVKYIPKKTTHGQGMDYYHVALPHVRESEVIPLDVWFNGLPDDIIVTTRDKARATKKRRLEKR